MRVVKAKEEDDSESEDEELTDINLWLEEYPRTGKSGKLENITFEQAKRELSRKETQENHQWRGVAIGTEKRHREMLNRCTRWMQDTRPNNMNIAVDRFIISRFIKEKREKNWTAGTLHAYLA
eukprot:Tbor_TRINITY_DN5452_c2_g2::TRINITY_DN5452_c2_g2_i2::g.24871::m.24871